MPCAAPATQLGPAAGTGAARDPSRPVTSTPETAAPRWLPRGRLARNSLLAMFWQAGRVGAQALWIIIMARLLGPAGYGAFSGVAGLANALGGFVGLGLGLLMYQEIATRREAFGARWRQTLATSLVTGVAFGILLVVAGGRWTGHAGWTIVLPLAISELVCFPLVTAAALAFAAHERMGWAMALPALVGVARLAAAATFALLLPDRGLAGYVWFHALVTVGCAAGAVTFVARELHPGTGTPLPTWRDVREGLGFSMVWVTGNALSSLDKALVLRFAGAEAAGIYSSAYRLATALAVPMDAVVTAAMPRLFRDGAVARPRLTSRLFALTLAYGALAGAVLWFAAGLLPLLLGARFAPAVHAAQWLGLFLPCYGMRILGSNLLMATRRKKLRMIIECAGLGTLVVFGVRWLPTLGVDGALRMIIGTELLLGLACWLALAAGLGAPRSGEA